MFTSQSEEENIVIEMGSPAFDKLQAAVNRYCLYLTGSPWDAEDLAQDTWLKAMGTLSRSGHNNSEAFLLRIAKNTWIDRSRRRKLLSTILQREAAEVTQPDHGALEIETAFAALSKHMSPLQRAVFLLRDVLGYSGAEAAGLLHTTEGAVKAALRRARLTLDAVRHELEKGGLSLPGDEGLKSFLRSLAVAYQSGDIARLVALVQQDALEPAMAIGIAQTRVLRARQAAARPGTTPTARMAA